MKNNDQLYNLASNEGLAIGLYNETSSKYVVILGNGIYHDVGEDWQGVYIADIPSNVTKRFVGSTDVEIAVYDKDNSEHINVQHADKLLTIYFQERNLNYDI